MDDTASPLLDVTAGVGDGEYWRSPVEDGDEEYPESERTPTGLAEEGLDAADGVECSDVVASFGRPCLPRGVIGVV